MNNTICDKKRLNTFKGVSRVPQLMINAMLENENIWKLIYYTYDEVTKSPIIDPLSMPNLTLSEKRNLIYLGKGSLDNFRIFFTTYPMQPQFEKQSQQLRILRGRTDPANGYTANISWIVELPCHEDVQTILIDGGQTPVNRVDLLQEEIFKTLNGKYVGGVGELQFNRDASVGFNDYSNWVDFNNQFSGLVFSMSSNFIGD